MSQNSESDKSENDPEDNLPCATFSGKASDNGNDA